MSNPRLRIVLVEADHSRRMSIEKVLSHLGYHRIVPVSSQQELIVLLENAVDVFDLLIINEQIMRTVGERGKNLLSEYPCLKHSLIYHGAQLQVAHGIGTGSVNPQCDFIASGVPDRPVLERVMAHVSAKAANGVSS